MLPEGISMRLWPDWEGARTSLRKWEWNLTLEREEEKEEEDSIQRRRTRGEREEGPVLSNQSSLSAVHLCWVASPAFLHYNSKGYMALTLRNPTIAQRCSLTSRSICLCSPWLLALPRHQSLKTLFVALPGASLYICHLILALWTSHSFCFLLLLRSFDLELFCVRIMYLDRAEAGWETGPQEKHPRLLDTWRCLLSLPRRQTCYLCKNMLLLQLQCPLGAMSGKLPLWAAASFIYIYNHHLLKRTDD